MEKYRKPNQYYIDAYDRATIKELKELELKEKKSVYVTYNLSSIEIKGPQLSLTFFRERGVMRAQGKEEFIRERMWEDEQKDRLVQQHSIPTDLRCNTCNETMEFENYLFKSGKEEILFVFSCPNGHIPKKVLYPNGREYIFKVRKCEKCGGAFKSTSVEKDNMLIFTDTCTGCGDVSVLELDLRDDPPIDEAERKKYCTDFLHDKTLMQTLEEMHDFMVRHEELKAEKEEKEELDFDKIEMLKIPNLEEKLSEALKRDGFIKFQLDKPEIGRYVTVAFSVQDPMTRVEFDSQKLLTKRLKEILFPTNWRLTSAGVSYRLGYLSGQLKAYERHEDLRKIAKQLAKSNPSKKE